jgi:predicted metalloprotease with PDZ domain
VESSSLSDEVFQGLRILSLFPGSVGERAGLRSGDRVLIANGLRMVSLADFANARRVYNDRLELTLRRGDHVFETVLIFEQPDAPLPDPALASA